MKLPTVCIIESHSLSAAQQGAEQGNLHAMSVLAAIETKHKNGFALVMPVPPTQYFSPTPGAVIRSTTLSFVPKKKRKGKAKAFPISVISKKKK